MDVSAGLRHPSLHCALEVTRRVIRDYAAAGAQSQPRDFGNAIGWQHV
jgi:hypothetical protein